MRHRKHGKILGRKQGPKKALMRGLAINLIDNDRIITTEAKAKALRPQVEKMVTKARVEEDKALSARRELISTLDNKEAVEKLMSDIAKRFAKRPGGYTRIIKLPTRQGDGAKMAQIEFVEIPERKAKPAKIEKAARSEKKTEKKAEKKETKKSEKAEVKK